MKRHILILYFILFVNIFATAQENEFSSLDSALTAPRESVIKLFLRKTKLDSIPKEIFEMKNLEVLDLSKNKIKTISPEIINLTKLRSLNLSKNKIVQLPEEIGKLQSLDTLIINQNEIEAFPRSIGELKNLIYLDAWSNEIEVFPEEMKNLEKLKMLDLRVIEIIDGEQKRIKQLLPNCTIHFSPSCQCAH